MITRRLRAFWVRLTGLSLRTQANNDIAAELESHIQMRIDDHLHAGMFAGEAG